jgi:hypothetical protein
MGLLDTRFIQKEIAGEGNTCTIIEVGRSTGSDEYRIVTETPTSNTGISCMTQILNEESEYVREGGFKSGDLIFWFDSDQESIAIQNNRITFDSKTFQIKDVEKFDVSGTTFLVRCMTEQI